ncbi:hypothetical protein D9758_004662 [Tetrapyrgos nigripes]|uniref:Alcohol dehydrogenase-like C-terminal domain-containing protein n=1 Tax=Tetrapyrgos nigripes TaxID=182062 RepID=A0A8H5GZK2_9AGAR|nr:hypothetical protein D9758_004662 [Tetrapyrgos nigripes]
MSPHLDLFVLGLAIAADARVTAHDAVANRAGVSSSSVDPWFTYHGTNAKVLIFGIGGLGHLTVQYARHFGATVYACDIKPKARKLALELGATEAFDLLDLNNKITWNGFKVDATIDFVSGNQTFQLGFNALKANDVDLPSNPTAVMVSVTEENLSLNVADMLTTGIKDIYTKGPVNSQPTTNPFVLLDFSILPSFLYGAPKPIISTLCEEPHRSAGVNKLKELLHKVIPCLHSFET